MSIPAENLLNDIKQITKCHDQCANQQGEQFNIFSILKMEKKEVETHSRFIYELLNPKGSHGQGDIFLQEFVKTVLGLNDAKNIKNPKREDVTKQSEDNGKIDFTIDSTNYVIGVEMKIHAGDQLRQMHRYYSELEERSKQKTGSGVKLFYLTLHGTSPSKESTEGLAENKYQNISFKEDVLPWIEKSIQIVATKSVLREALIQYKLLIEKLTGINKGKKMAIAKLILKSEDNMEAALSLSSSLTQAKIELQTRFWKTLLAELNTKHEFEFYSEQSDKNKIEELVKNYYTKSQKIKHYGLRCKLNGSFSGLSNGQSLYFYIHLNHIIHYGFRVVSGDGKVEILKDKKETLRDNLTTKDDDWNAKANNGETWIFSKYGPSKLDFVNIGKPVISLLRPSNDNSDAINVDVSTLVEDIKRLVESVEENANKD